MSLFLLTLTLSVFAYSVTHTYISLKHRRIHNSNSRFAVIGVEILVFALWIVLVAETVEPNRTMNHVKVQLDSFKFTVRFGLGKMANRDLWFGSRFGLKTD